MSKPGSQSQTATSATPRATIHNSHLAENLLSQPETQSQLGMQSQPSTQSESDIRLFTFLQLFKNI